MRVIKRTGETEEVSFDKVLNRIRNLCNDDLKVDFFDIAQKVCSRIYDNVKTSELDELAAHICSSMIIENPDYGILASRIIISNHHKNTSPSFSETIYILGDLVSSELYDIVMKNKEKLNSYIDYSRDYTFDYFGFKTLEKSYLMRMGGNVIERPQHMFMRVALGIHKDDFKDALHTYDMMSKKYFVHATPTLFNFGTPRPQGSSCFLLHMNDDSVSGIFESLHECALISKYAGGIGIHVHNIRSKGSKIRGTNGTSSGILPMLRVFNNTARYIDQAGRRAGSIAVYVEPWHADVFEFLELKKPHGHEEERARDLFYALWIPDLFMQRVKEDGVWSLMCPDACKGLSDCWGADFVKLYEQYERERKYVKQVKAQELWFKVLESQIETGTPYLCYKDAANAKSNQQNLGTIKSSNLCVAPETMILTDKGYYPIECLNGQQVAVWNGKEFSRTVVHKTGNMQKLLTIKFNNGMSLKCTPYHKFYIDVNNSQFVVEAQNLVVGMKIIQYNIPTLNVYGQELNNAYTQGLLAASGTYMKNDNHSKPFLSLYGEKKKLVKHADWLYMSDDIITNRLNVGLPHDMEDKYFVPLNHTLESKLRWLEGYLDGDGYVDNCIGLRLTGDGCVVNFKGLKNVQVSSSNKQFLTNLFLMLQTLGVTSVIQDDGKFHMADGMGGYQLYDRQACYIDGQGLLHLQQLGFKPKHLDLSSLGEPCYLTNKSIKISAVEDNGEYNDTYCFNEPLEHKGVFNGILTGQCSEIMEYTSPEEIAVCNLASICLPTFVEVSKDDGKPFYNFEKLHDVAKVLTKNLNKVIDGNFYPLEKARRSNFRHRPIGIGVQGLADAFVLMRLPFDSNEAKELNKLIFETIYHGAVEESMEIAKKRYNNVVHSLNSGIAQDAKVNEYLYQNEFEPSFDSKYPGAYSTFEGSPASLGKLQFDLWGVTCSDMYNWDSLKKDVIKYGMRNSLLLSPMPTASTSQIMGFTEAFEPVTSNIYKRKTMAGEFVLVNKYLIKDLIQLDLWNKDIRQKIIVNEGSVQSIEEIPQNIRDIYKVVWEISQKTLIDMAADRGAYVCQSQSMNLFLEDPDFKKLSSMHFYAWQKGLKTGVYYLRTKPKAKVQQFTIVPEKKVVCNAEDGVCLMCSS